MYKRSRQKLCRASERAGMGGAQAFEDIEHYNL